MTRFTSTAQDPRRLRLCAHEIARQHPGRREHVHGRVRPMRSTAPTSREIATRALLLLLLVAITWIVIPGAAWLTLEIGKAL